ncbi:MAG TPA: methyltransferase [Thermoanaerobaculia bacterium]
MFCSRSFRWIARRRGALTVALALVALASALWGRRGPVDLFGPGASPFGGLLWALTILGTLVRIWGAGNLRKNKEVTRTGIYRMVRHPLYLGNCLIYLAFLLSLAGPVVGSSLFLLLYALHYPLMLQEEERLAREYPEQFETWQGTPRLLPDLSAFGEALANDCFCFRRAWQNRAYRTLWAPVLLPAVTEALSVLRGYV